MGRDFLGGAMMPNDGALSSLGVHGRRRPGVGKFHSKMKPEQFREVSETRIICPKSQIGRTDI